MSVPELTKKGVTASFHPNNACIRKGNTTIGLVKHNGLWTLPMPKMLRIAYSSTHLVQCRFWKAGFTSVACLGSGKSPRSRNVKSQTIRNYLNYLNTDRFKQNQIFLVALLRGINEHENAVRAIEMQTEGEETKEAESPASVPSTGQKKRLVLHSNYGSDQPSSKLLGHRLYWTLNMNPLTPTLNVNHNKNVHLY